VADESIALGDLGLAAPERVLPKRARAPIDFSADAVEQRKANAAHRNGHQRSRLGAPASSPPARGYDAAELLSMPMAEPNYTVRPFVPEGVVLWCGRPKLGKTTILRQLALAVNKGGVFLGEQCDRAEVWFLSLEEGERLARKKLMSMSPAPDDWRGIRFEFEWPRAAQGVELLRERLLSRPPGGLPVLIVIDSLTRFRQVPSARGHAFTEDYEAVKLLADLCKAFPGLAVVVLHHTTKAVPDDPVSAISGTYGLTAAADSYCIMLRQGQQFRLHAGGRLWDRDTNDFELQRHGGTWGLLGEWDNSAPQGLTPKQQNVIDALRSGSKSNRELAERTGQGSSALSHMMAKLEDRGLVNRIANGWGLAR
jgi:hypothetical protein